MRQTVTVWHATDSGTRVHNQQHAHTERPSCTWCRRYGVAVITIPTPNDF
jgi:hypothetical protein